MQANKESAKPKWSWSGTMKRNWRSLPREGISRYFAATLIGMNARNGADASPQLRHPTGNLAWLLERRLTIGSCACFNLHFRRPSSKCRKWFLINLATLLKKTVNSQWKTAVRKRFSYHLPATCCNSCCQKLSTQPRPRPSLGPCVAQSHQQQQWPKKKSNSKKKTLCLNAGKNL